MQQEFKYQHDQVADVKQEVAAIQKRQEYMMRLLAKVATKLGVDGDKDAEQRRRNEGRPRSPDAHLLVEEELQMMLVAEQRVPVATREQHLAAATATASFARRATRNMRWGPPGPRVAPSQVDGR